MSSGSGRSDDAIQQKLDAIAEGLDGLLTELATDDPGPTHERTELADAIGLEDRESSQ